MGAAGVMSPPLALWLARASPNRRIWVYTNDRNRRVSPVAASAGSCASSSPPGLVNLNNHSEKSGRDELSETIGICILYATIPGAQNVNLTKPRRAFGNPALSCGGTKSSNPSPSAGESANFWFLGDRLACGGCAVSRSAAARSYSPAPIAVASAPARCTR